MENPLTLPSTPAPANARATLRAIASTPTIGAARLQNVAASQIQKLLADLQKNGKGRFGKQPERKDEGGGTEACLAPQSALHVHRTLNSALKAPVEAKSTGRRQRSWEN